MGGGGSDAEVGAARILPRIRFAAELDELLAYAVSPRERREVARATGRAMRRTGFIVNYLSCRGYRRVQNEDSLARPQRVAKRKMPMTPDGEISGVWSGSKAVSAAA